MFGSGSAGIGAVCTGNTVNDTIPAAAQPGAHTVTATITYPSNTQLPPITLSAVFTVTATAASTPIPGATTIPPTNTPVPSAPTAANTTSTATATPAPQAFLMLVAPNFAFHTVSVSVRGAPNAKVKLQLTITQGSSRVYTLTQEGTTNKAGVYGAMLNVTYAKLIPGKATIHGTISWGGKTTSAVHSVAYP